MNAKQTREDVLKAEIERFTKAMDEILKSTIGHPGFSGRPEHPSENEAARIKRKSAEFVDDQAQKRYVLMIETVEKIMPPHKPSKVPVNMFEKDTKEFWESFFRLQKKHTNPPQDQKEDVTEINKLRSHNEYQQAKISVLEKKLKSTQEALNFTNSLLEMALNK
jgi:hypothetical protein